MPQTIRKYWGAFNGRVTFNYNDDYRFIGGSSITVENIAPHGPPYDANHGVSFVVNVDWGSPLNIVTDITVLDNPPIEIDYPSSSVPHLSTATSASASASSAPAPPSKTSLPIAHPTTPTTASPPL